MEHHANDGDSIGVHQCDTDMYRGAMTRVKTICGMTDYFESLNVTLHYNTYFIIIIDVLSEEVVSKPAWVILFADDSVLVNGTVEEV